jgi:hypothetical protein
MAFTQKVIEVSFKLTPGGRVSTFNESGTDTLTIRAATSVGQGGLRISAKCLKMATPGLGMLEMSIYGLTLSVMNQLATLGIRYQLVSGNTVTVKAGEAGANALPTVFIGTVVQPGAWANFEHMPDVPFHVTAQAMGDQAVIMIPPTSVKGTADAAQLIEGIVGQMPGYTFENNGVNAKLSNPYFYGSPRSQIQACANAAGCDWNVDNNTVAIVPKGKARGGNVPTIAPPPTGQMIGYPTFTEFGLKLKTAFDPTLRMMGDIKVQSSILASAGQPNPSNAPAQPAGGGTWRIFAIDHDIDTLVHRGKWQTTIEAWNPAFPQPIPPSVSK